MFQVVWLQAALHELADIWTQANSSQRRAITAATHRIDQLLQTDPHLRGESRPPGQRVLFQPPLGIVFQALPQRSLVRVFPVWRFRQRGEAGGPANS
jgi:hypothetical protein